MIDSNPSSILANLCEGLDLSGNVLRKHDAKKSIGPKGLAGFIVFTGLVSAERIKERCEINRCKLQVEPRMVFFRYRLSGNGNRL